MIFKYYPIVILVLGILLGSFVYSVTEADFVLSLPFSDKTYTMPVAVWIVVLTYGIFFISIIFLFTERFAKFLEKGAIKNDKNTFIKKIKYKIIQRDDSNLKLKTAIFKELGGILDNVDIVPKPHMIACENNDMKKLFAMYENLNNGEEIDVGKFDIPQTSTLFTQNTKNMITKNYKNGLGILKNKNYIYELKKCAFMALLQNGEKDEIEKYKDSISYDKEIAFGILGVFLNQKITLNKEEIGEMCKNTKFTKDDYIKFAKLSRGKIEPSNWIRIFEFLADNDEVAETSYLYVLLELEMLDSVKSRLKSHAMYEFAGIRAYLDLKSMGKTYPAEIFFKN